ncbi:MAG: NADH-quinone oxidoreductase subunit J [Candidatus Adiutrix sp.]|jgi:NADH-quinone oxidoreductase subunit J|nr:NADH-quinone oxidoreductase subunit J [Candidatus Adiutrix sp.]
MGGLLFASAVGVTPTPSFFQELAAMVLPTLGHQIMAYAAFGLYVLLIVGGGLAAALARTLVRALMGLVVTFLGVAGMYLLMASPFLAFMQLLIYIGAICVLIFFAIMLVRNTASGEEMHLPGLGQAAFAGLSAVGVLAVFGPVIVLNAGALMKDALPTETPLAELGEGLLNYYVMPFELISVILLVAMAGGAFLAYERRFKAQDEVTKP